MPEHPLNSLVGDRRPLGIGISAEEFRRDHLEKPTAGELSRYSSNPRNAAGDWYEDHIRGLLGPLCTSLGLEMKIHENLGHSEVYLSNKVVDTLLLARRPRSRERDALGLELKFLGGSGSLVNPKILIDVIDFTRRPVYCLYVIDGEGWLKASALEYLAHWWDFTCAAHLERTVRSFFSE